MNASQATEAAARAFWLIKNWKIVLVMVVIVVLAFFSLLLVAAASNDNDAAPNNSPCVPESLEPPVVVAPPGDVRAEQIANAKTIDQVAADLGLSGRASRIGIITAMGESSLINLGYGDVAGPDSRGLFQQRHTMGWGTLQQTMEPEFAATSFFLGRTTNKGLTQIPGWEGMEPTAAIHAVQRNADPNHYAKFYGAADAVINEAEIDVDRQANEERQEAEGVPTDTGKADSGQCDPNGGGDGGEGTVPTGDGKDDYPWSGNVPGAGVYVADPMGFFYGECTSWAGWVINRNAGSTKAPFKYSYANGNFVNGNAKEWKSRWLARGWKVSKTPVSGAVAWWDAGSGGAGWAGHVAIVHEVLDDGRVVIEEYNRTPPGEHQYGIREPQPASVADAYLYPPE